jgi:hypothetical protein
VTINCLQALVSPLAAWPKGPHSPIRKGKFLGLILSQSVFSNGNRTKSSDHLAMSRHFNHPRARRIVGSLQSIGSKLLFLSWAKMYAMEEGYSIVPTLQYDSTVVFKPTNNSQEYRYVPILPFGNPCDKPPKCRGLPLNRCRSQRKSNRRRALD